jgi:hypothetical protein
MALRDELVQRLLVQGAALRLPHGGASGSSPQVASCCRMTGRPRQERSAVCPRLRCAPASVPRPWPRAHPASWPAPPPASPHAAGRWARGRSGPGRWWPPVGPLRRASCHGECQFQARHKSVFQAVAQAPVAAGAQGHGWRPTGGFGPGAAWSGHSASGAVGMGGLRPHAGDFGKGLEQLGLHAGFVVFRCSADQAGLACTVQRSTVPRPGLDDSRASQAMRWWVLRAAFHWGPSVVRSLAHGLRVGQHQRPAGGHGHRDRGVVSGQSRPT